MNASGSSVPELRDRVWLAVGVVILALASFALLRALMPALVPFIYATAIVYLVKPLFEFLCGRGLPRVLALVASYLLFFLVIGLFLVFVIPAFVDQGRQLAAELPGMADQLSRFALRLQRIALAFEVPPWAREALKNAGQSALAWVTGLASRIPEAGLGLATGLLNVVLAIFLSFYILKDWNRLRASLFGFLRKKGREDLVALLKKGNVILSGFIRGQLLIAFVIGVTTSMALAIMGVNFALLLGMITGVLDLVPYFGPVVGGVLAFLVALIESPTLAIWVVVVMAAIQQLESVFVAPHIMSSRVEVHPALVVFAFLVGGLSFGTIGLLLAIPVAAFVKAAFVQYFVGAGEELDGE